LLEAHRGVPNRLNVPRLTPELILQWADAHFVRTGRWPNRETGDIPESPGDAWRNIEDALRQRGRGLRGASSLARLLAKYRGARNHMGLPRLTLKQILAWADCHHERTGKWPTIESGPVGVEGQTWKGIHMALLQGLRGLKGGSSLAKLQAKQRGFRNRADLPQFGLRKILAWADDHKERTGAWPNQKTGQVLAAGGETWAAIEMALTVGLRGLKGGDSIARLLLRHSRVPRRGRNRHKSGK
jgi:hypothetical protein